MVSDETLPSVLDIQRILEVLPHRYPFLMVDRMEDVVRGESAVGIKNVSINEPYFQGHFPGAPVMPGVLMVEAMAQTAGILVIETLGREMEGKLVYFMSVEGARFRRPVRPATGCASMCRNAMPGGWSGSSTACARLTARWLRKRPTPP